MCGEKGPNFQCCSQCMMCGEKGPNFQCCSQCMMCGEKGPNFQCCSQCMMCGEKGPNFQCCSQCMMCGEKGPNFQCCRLLILSEQNLKFISNRGDCSINISVNKDQISPLRQKKMSISTFPIIRLWKIQLGITTRVIIQPEQNTIYVEAVLASSTL